MKAQDFQDQIEAMIGTVTDAMGKIKRLSREQEGERVQFRSESRAKAERIAELEAELVNVRGVLAESVKYRDALQKKCDDLFHEARSWENAARNLGWIEKKD